MTVTDETGRQYWQAIADLSEALRKRKIKNPLRKAPSKSPAKSAKKDTKTRDLLEK